MALAFRLLHVSDDDYQLLAPNDLRIWGKKGVEEDGGR